MKNYILVTIIAFSSILMAEELTANEILTRVMNRTNGLNHSFELDVLKSQKGKPNKAKRLKISSYWPKGGSISRMSVVETLAPDNLKDVRFWEHRFKNGSKAKRWMTMPLTGKLKDISNKLASQNEFNLSELEITPEIIAGNENKIVGKEKILGKDAIILESIKTRGKKMRTMVWVDSVEFFVLKAEFYTKSGRKSKVIKMGDLAESNGMTFPQKIDVEDLRKKITFAVKVEKLNTHILINESDFYPRALQK
ncbi:MAG: outer membrane lipoprotein-sorting protein [Candidatus Marinimicrobia bacterium]|nr:outer membrane lipoprotein-sorting protein [Candidatus Neomarinimicrobiota bacterium]